MKKQCLLLFLFIVYGCFSQNLDKLKNNEVLFVISENHNGDFFKKTKVSKNEKDTKRDSFWYDYYFKDGSIIKFSYREYTDFDKKEKNKPALFFSINKSFLRKNKDIIITKQFMHKIGCSKSMDLLKNAKTILLIEENPNNKKEVMLKEVILFEIGIE